LSISLVLFHPDQAALAATLEALVIACQAAQVVPVLHLVDNGGASLPPGLSLPAGWRVVWHRGQGNVGFGRGHNLALAQLGQYHLILNPDLELAPDALRHALAFMDAHPDCGLLAPAARWADGRLQYLCKRMPTLLDLLVRGFVPARLRKPFARRLARYEMQDLVNEHDVLWSPPIVSGCCMLFKSQALRALGGFDPRFFLYFEDFDLSLRAGRITRIAYVPQVGVVHHGGHAARKGWHHIRLFGASARVFFQIHGWRWW
jgi:GT2 family glycosyltransferase